MMITSFQNPLVKRIKRLKQKKYRQQEGLFFVEGLRVVGAAVQAGATIEQLVYCDALLVSEFGRSLLQKAPTVEVSAAIFRTLSQRDHPAGIGAIIKRTANDTLQITSDGVYVALFGASDPGNVGTIIRTADAAGANGVILVGDTVDVTHPAVIKASMGAFFSVPIAAMSEAAFAEWAADIRTLATSAKGTVAYRTADYTTPLVLMMGSEREGLAAKWLDSAAQQLTIPMHGTSSSLNLAVATALLLYETQQDH